MSLQNIGNGLKISEVDTSGLSQGEAVYRLSQVAFFTELGLVGGATGVALAIGLTILLQSLALGAFVPGAVLLTTMSVLIGLGATWLLGRVMRRVLPRLFGDWNNQALEMALVFGVFASLLQSVFFTHGL
jgi:hypothetical protein